jgi:hypothetical protein
MAELIALPSLAMSPMAFSLMASNLRRGVADLAQGGCILLPESSRLLQLGLNLWKTCKNKTSWRAREKEKDRTNVQDSLWSYSDERLMASSFSTTLSIAAFHSCLTVASCTTIPTQIRHAPAFTTDESGPDKEQAPNQTRSGGDHPTYHQDPALES